MTHVETIDAISRLRSSVVDIADAHLANHRRLTQDALSAAATAHDFLEQAADYSGILRQLDPDNADQYPDPAEASSQLGAVVHELRHLANLLANIGLPPIERSINVGLHLHGVRADRAKDLLAHIAESRDDLVRHSDLTGRGGYTGGGYRGSGAVKVDFSIYHSSEPVPVPEPEPFVQATPAEVAQAYESTPQGHAQAAFEAGDRVRVTSGTAKTLGRCGFVRALRHDAESRLVTGVNVVLDGTARAKRFALNAIEHLDDLEREDAAAEAEALETVDPNRQDDADARQEQADHEAEARLQQADHEAYQDYLGDEDEPPATPASAPRDEQPIQVGDRVRVHSADAEARDFPPEYEDCEGVVMKVEEALPLPADVAVDVHEMPIEVLLDGHAGLQCFAVAEVTVQLPSAAESVDERLVGQPA